MTHQYKVGDKVRALVDFKGILEGETATVIAVWNANCGDKSAGVDIQTLDGRISEFYNFEVEPVSDTHKAWKDMTDAEKGALLLAQHEGSTIQVLALSGIWVDWPHPDWSRTVCYRIKPDPAVEVIERSVFTIGVDTVNVAVTLTDGKATSVELVE